MNDTPEYAKELAKTVAAISEAPVAMRPLNINDVNDRRLIKDHQRLEVLRKWAGSEGIPFLFQDHADNLVYLTFRQVAIDEWIESVVVGNMLHGALETVLILIPIEEYQQLSKALGNKVFYVDLELNRKEKVRALSITTPYGYVYVTYQYADTVNVLVKY